MKKERKAGESLMEKHIVSRSEISVERHFDHSCSLSLNAVMKLLQMLDRDMEKGDEEKCPALSVAKNSAAKNTSLYDLEKQSVRICGSSKCIQAFKCELRRRHRHKNVLSKEILS